MSYIPEDYLRISGEWSIGIALGYHNIDPAPTQRVCSINDLKCRLSELGRLVYIAKFNSDKGALDTLGELLISSAKVLYPFDDVYYIPHRDSSSSLNPSIALKLAIAFSCKDCMPAFDWLQFHEFRKGMSKIQIEMLINHCKQSTKIQNTEVYKNCLLIDDTTWSSSTLYLAHQYLKRTCRALAIKVLCITKVRT